MGMTRLGTDGSLPNIDFTQVTVALVTNNVAAVFSATSRRARRALVKAPTTNPAAVTVGPTSGANYASLAAGDEYLIESAAEHTYDLASWYAKSADATSTLVVIYQ